MVTLAWRGKTCRAHWHRDALRRTVRVENCRSSMKKLYVGNLPWSVDDGELQALFTSLGTVHSARVITDRETGRSRGFGFVELDDDAAQKAIAELNGSDFGGRALKVNEANDRRR
jgi:RNA recognition motif-containing protein